MVSTVLNEGRRPAEFMISEGPGLRSRDVGHFVNSGTVELDLPAGLVLGQLAADFSFAAYTNAGTLGLQAAVGVLWDNLRIPASGTVAATYVARDAEVNAAELQYAAGVDAPGKAAALADLRALGIIAR
jgi:hypothetical protein